ncbi:hypothetical protein QUF63_07700 [Anaerolineales bacterium HSG25]|nr:hypothetical protein [Anaerolineales bacterium HSG25]
MALTNTLTKKLSARLPMILGISLIIIGIIANEWILVPLLSSDGQIEPRNIVIIWGFDLLCVSAGLILLISRSFVTLLNVAIGVLITLVMLYGLEWLFYYLNHRPPPPTTAEVAPPPPAVQHEGTYTHDFFHDDELLGYKPRPLAQVDSVKKLGDEILYDVIYSIDEYSRRVTPFESNQQVESNRQNRPNTMLFFGDSFMFGEGVQDDETLPYYVTFEATNYQPYNYGFSGYGPQQMLAKLESDALRDELPTLATSNKITLIYVFIDAHVERAIGSMYVHNAWGDKMPYYTIDWSGNLIRQGNFTTGRPIIATLYKQLPNSEIASYFNVTIPPRLTDRHYKFTAQLIAAARDTFQDKFGSDQFYVVVYPDEGDYFEDIQPHFETAGLNVLNYDKRMKLDPEAGLGIKNDGHPTGKAHQQVARWIIEDLGMSIN